MNLIKGLAAAVVLPLPALGALRLLAVASEWFGTGCEGSGAVWEWEGAKSPSEARAGRGKGAHSGEC